MRLLSWFAEKLVRRLVGPSLLLGVLAVVLLSLMTYVTVRDLLEKSVSDRLKVAVDLQEKELQRWIDDQKTTVVFISRAPFVRERVVDLLSRPKDHVYYRRSYRELSEYLFSYIKNFSGLREITILSSRDGRVVFSTIPEHIDEFRGEDTFFLEGQKSLFIQGVYPGRETRLPTITIARPLLGALGEKDGVLAVHLNLQRMAEVVLDHPGLGPSGEVHLLDRFNAVLDVDGSGRAELPPGVRSAAAGRGSVGQEGVSRYANSAGIPVVGYFRWVPELDVAILAEIAQSEAFFAAEQLGLMIASLGLALIVCLVVGNIFFARRLAEPLAEMAVMAQKVAAGDFSTSVPVTGADETGDLARALNQMVSHLQDAYGELGNTAEFFKTVFNLNPSAIAVQRHDNGAFVHVNEGFCQMFDVKATNVLGRTLEELQIWKSNFSRLRLAAILNSEKVVREFEADFVRRNGEVFRGMISSRVLDLSGEKHVISILADLSEVKGAEREKRKTTERLQLLVQRMPIGCITWSTDFRVELWNPEAERIFGFSESEAVGRHAYELIVPAAIRPLVAPIWKKLLEGDETAHSENDNITKDGRTIVCDWYNTPLKNEQGEPTGVISMVRDITDRKKAEEGLRHQKELLQTILDAIPAPIFFKDREGVYLGCNRAFTDYLGCPYERIVGHTVFDIAPADKARVYEAADQELIRQGGVQIYEATVRYADGSDRNVVFHKAVYRNPDGSVGGLVGNMLDVTESRRAEAELAESEQNYREIFNASAEAIFLRDMKTKELLDVNQAMLEMYGYDYDEALLLETGQMCSGRPPYTAEQALRWMDLAREGKPQLFEWQARKKDGTLFWTEIALKQIVIRGEPRLLSVVRDITDRKEAERAQRESEERFQLLLEHAADALFLHDNEGVILTVNQRACDSLGYSREELLGMTVDELEKGVTIGQLKSFWESLVANESTLIPGEHRRRDGSTYPVDVNVVKFEFQGAWFYLALARDVTERRATEMELERYRNQLEELVTERTRQLEEAQEELVQKERLAVLGQLTATVSHELRNPLGTVKNAVYLLRRLREADAMEKAEKSLDLADRNIRRCDEIINELLDYTRQHEGTPVEIDVAAWLQAILDEQFCPEEIRVVRNWKKGVRVSVVPERLRRAFINVYTNAIQALQEVSTRRRVLKVKVETGADRVKIIVADNGPGIRDDVLERIFEPMFSTKNFGVGLGMPIVRNIMEEHGGGVEVESVYGRGSTVILWLPATE